ncbi:MAG: hypothetical protein GXP47_07395 [Acidobacteria bacterium]|nr:hypothetical protein [Acidobacteriota bacterium]
MNFDMLSWNLIAAAIGIAAAHTVLGPDHYLPFVMLARARGWGRTRTVIITVACGIGHVGSSILLGGLGVLTGVALSRLQGFEGLRGGIAAWALVAFGLAYTAWGVRRALRSRSGGEIHAHGGHVHIHTHGAHRHHHHQEEDTGSSTTFWTLFIVFVLGPCEPLIPLFMVPAARGRWGLAMLTASVFGVVTIALMVALVLAGAEGLRRLPLGSLERWAHSMAGAVIAASGLAVIFLGL